MSPRRTVAAGREEAGREAAETGAAALEEVNENYD